MHLRIPPLALVAAFGAGSALAAHAFPAANLPFPGHRVVAAAALLAGAAIVVAGVVAFVRAGTTVSPLAPGRTSALVTRGVYRWSRNPMYLGMALALFGVAAWPSTLVGYALAALFCLGVDRFQIVPEERALRARFGEEFAAYARRVRRWI